MEFISIVPNIKNSIAINEEIINLISSAEENISRIVIQDNNGYGVCLPASINKEDSVVEFILPEQLCIFLDSETYLCKFECILETQIIVPFIMDARIDLKDDYVNEIDPTEEEAEETLKSNAKASRHPDEHDDEADMDSILDAIAPKPAQQPKKAHVEDIIKNLDEEFVKQALWIKEQNKQNPKVEFVQHIPEVVPVSKERVVLKNKMKNILLDMLK
jgi:hypothetical protein